MGTCQTVILKDSDDGWVNLGTYRLMVVDRNRLALHVLESDHRLHNQIRVIQYLFEYFLIALDLPATAFE